eukprot:TRINITY_DN1141_c0_g1_i1.p1 TRINITY_DN1141_c0_g1~~TRINITY_DN1141_c0_g1_i1.p1  ORF type:complete len:319 (-),score=10.01 TRINITY_DN1141_c0_g1_i1:168-1124(-)
MWSESMWLWWDGQDLASLHSLKPVRNDSLPPSSRATRQALGSGMKNLILCFFLSGLAITGKVPSSRFSRQSPNHTAVASFTTGWHEVPLTDHIVLIDTQGIEVFDSASVFTVLGTAPAAQAGPVTLSGGNAALISGLVSKIAKDSWGGIKRLFSRGATGPTGEYHCPIFVVALEDVMQKGRDGHSHFQRYRLLLEEHRKISSAYSTETEYHGAHFRTELTFPACVWPCQRVEIPPVVVITGCKEYIENGTQQEVEAECLRQLSGCSFNPICVECCRPHGELTDTIVKSVTEALTMALHKTDLMLATPSTVFRKAHNNV